MSILCALTFKTSAEIITNNDDFELQNDKKDWPVPDQKFCDQVKLLKGKDYWLACMSSSITLSTYYAFSTVLGQLIVPFGSTNVNFLGVLLNSMGIFGAITFSIIQTRCGLSFLNSNRIIAVLTLVSVGLFWFVIDSKVGLMVTVGLIGFVNIPILFTAYELAVE